MDQEDDSTDSSKKRKAEEEEGCGGGSCHSDDKVKESTVETVAAAATRPRVVPITQEGDRPQKKFYRQRAHCNPLSHNDSFEYPLRPDLMDWTTDAFYPGLKKGDINTVTNNNANRTNPVAVVTAHAQPTVLDVGCGFGGLTLALARLLPDEIILGMEIRAKVTEYVRLRIAAARKDPATALLEDDGEMATTSTTCAATTTADNATSTLATITTATTTSTTSTGPGPSYQNAAVLRTNSMKFLPHYFAKHSLKKLFFCFPDPQFKRKNHARRIISDRLLTEYAYLLQPSVGKLYCITDVRELHEWHVKKCSAHACFECIVVVHPQDPAASSSSDIVERAMQEDPCIRAMMQETEEGKKVHRNGGDKFFAVYRRLPVTYPFSATTTTADAAVSAAATTTTRTMTVSLDASNFFA